MKQHYFVVVLAHSLHGRLRRIQIPHQAFYLILILALCGSFSLFGMVSSYLRMTWKVANYNSLRSEVDTLRTKYQALQRENNQKQEQLASLQLMASEVSMALGLKRRLEGNEDLAEAGRLVPSYTESIEEYNFLKSASFSRLHHTYARSWQKNLIPTIWPVNGRLLSRFGERQDPFSGEGAFHTGVDISASMGTPVHAAADGIVGLGHADALPEGVAWESGPQGKVAYQPAICDRIIESKRVSLIIEGARSARQPRKE